MNCGNLLFRNLGASGPAGLTGLFAIISFARQSRTKLIPLLSLARAAKYLITCFLKGILSKEYCYGTYF
jgi:hypothetical protein